LQSRRMIPHPAAVPFGRPAEEESRCPPRRGRCTGSGRRPS
jgi:hypothetical protein